MVIAVLHDINLATQYADRILLLKSGRKWLEGTPTEVITPAHIYAIFNTDVEVITHAKTLRPIVIPRTLAFDVTTFNSLLPPYPSDVLQQELKSKWAI